MKRIGLLCLLVPFVFSALNIQGFVTIFFSTSLGQLVAYLNVILVIIGSVLFLNHRQPFAKIVTLWIWFFVCYFVIGSIASAVHDTETISLKALIPFVYLIGTAVFLSIPAYHKIFMKTAAASFFLSAVLVIVLQELNFSVDVRGVHIYELERAGGVYGDANQSALVCLLAFIFVYRVLKPETRVRKIIKFLLLCITIFALILTFSKTGFVVLLIVLGLTFHQFFTPKKLIGTIVVIPLFLITTVNLALNSGHLTSMQKDRIENVVSILTFNTEKVDFSGRDVLLQNMLNQVYDNPIIGNGISFSNSISGHNTIIGVWADAGIITFILFLFILFQYFMKSWNSSPEVRYFALPAVFALVIFMLSLQSIINQPYLIALLVYLAYIIETPKVISKSMNEPQRKIKSVTV